MLKLAKHPSGQPKLCPVLVFGPHLESVFGGCKLSGSSPFWPGLKVSQLLLNLAWQTEREREQARETN